MLCFGYISIIKIKRMTTTRQINTSQLTMKAQQQIYEYLTTTPGMVNFVDGGGGIIGKTIFLKFKDATFGEGETMLGEIIADRVINDMVSLLSQIHGFAAKKTSDGNIVITNATLNKYQIKKSKFKKKYK
jgi:hypothetical protein